MYDMIGRIGFMGLLFLCVLLLLVLSDLRLRLGRTKQDLNHRKMVCDYLQKQVQDLQREGSALTRQEVDGLQREVRTLRGEADVARVKIEKLSIANKKLTRERDDLSTSLSNANRKLDGYRDLCDLKPDRPDACWYGSRIFSMREFLSIGDQIPVFSGVYVIQNVVTGSVYVQCSESVAEQCLSHFRKQGSIDIRSDLSKGHDFRIQLIPFEGSGYHSVNDLCSEMAIHYNVYFKGYRGSYGK